MNKERKTLTHKFGDARCSLPPCRVEGCCWVGDKFLAITKEVGWAVTFSAGKMRLAVTEPSHIYIPHVGTTTPTSASHIWVPQPSPVRPFFVFPNPILPTLMYMLVVLLSMKVWHLPGQRRSNCDFFLND